MSQGTDNKSKIHQFGGDWTSRKLDIVQKYLSAYTTALKEKPSKEKPFIKGYIDAFAGSGTRIPTQKDDDLQLQLPGIFDDSLGFLEGSVRQALQVEPSFDRYVFIERNLERCSELETLKQDFPAHAGKIEIINQDANEYIKKICRPGVNWSSRRAVLFLDPYGMQVDWSTLEAIASTKAIDLWYLFPLGVGVNRLLIKSGEIPEAWCKSLDRMFGTRDWYQEVYSVKKERDLFDQDKESKTKVSWEDLGKIFNKRLATIFAGVAERPAVLKNSKNNPLYLLCFAVGNQRGKIPALNIANDLLKRVGE
jgi:three-Cys-motif partner protein